MGMGWHVELSTFKKISHENPACLNQEYLGVRVTEPLPSLRLHLSLYVILSLSTHTHTDRQTHTHTHTHTQRYLVLFLLLLFARLSGADCLSRSHSGVPVLVFYCSCPPLSKPCYLHPCFLLRLPAVFEPLPACSSLTLSHL